MSKIAIKIKSTGQIVQTDVGNLSMKVGDWLLVETPQCKEVAEVVDESRLKDSQVEKGDVKEEEIEVIRKLTEKDIAQRDDLKKIARNLILECQQKIDNHKLPMQLLDAELSFDEKKLTES